MVPLGGAVGEERRRGRAGRGEGERGSGGGLNRRFRQGCCAGVARVLRGGAGCGGDGRGRRAARASRPVWSGAATVAVRAAGPVPGTGRRRRPVGTAPNASHAWRYGCRRRRPGPPHTARPARRMAPAPETLRTAAGSRGDGRAPATPVTRPLRKRPPSERPAPNRLPSPGVRPGPPAGTSRDAAPAAAECPATDPSAQAPEGREDTRNGSRALRRQTSRPAAGARRFVTAGARSAPSGAVRRGKPGSGAEAPRLVIACARPAPAGTRRRAGLRRAAVRRQTSRPAAGDPPASQPSVQAPFAPAPFAGHQKSQPSSVAGSAAAGPGLSDAAANAGPAMPAVSVVPSAGSISRKAPVLRDAA